MTEIILIISSNDRSSHKANNEQNSGTRGNTVWEWDKLAKKTLTIKFILELIFQEPPLPRVY